MTPSFIPVSLLRSLELFVRAQFGTEIWGVLEHPQAGKVPASLQKTGRNEWTMKLRVTNHPGFPWRLNDREAFAWALTNAR